MSAGKIIAYIVAAITIFFGILFIWGAFSPSGSTGWIFVGLISVGIGLALIARLSEHLGWPLDIQPGPDGQGTRVRLDLSGSLAP